MPPKAAAIVPDSKSSEDVVATEGESRWVWTSMPPGMTYFPVASIVLSAGNRSAGRLLPTAEIVPFAQ